MVQRSIALKQLKLLEKNSEQMPLAAENWGNDWQRLVAIMLSARTRDEVTIKVCKNMFSKYGSLYKFQKLKLKEIKTQIHSVNFSNNKSKNLFLMNKILYKEFNNKIPDEIEDLIKLPGIGRKTANVFLAEVGGDNIGVDTHVSYISQYLNWVNSNKPEIIEEQLKKLFPKSKWKYVNRILVRFGKTHTSRKKKNELLDRIKEKTK